MMVREVKLEEVFVGGVVPSEDVLRTINDLGGGMEILVFPDPLRLGPTFFRLRMAGHPDRWFVEDHAD